MNSWLDQVIFGSLNQPHHLHEYLTEVLERLEERRVYLVQLLLLVKQVLDTLGVD
jgi:hypothetical protein